MSITLTDREILDFLENPLDKGLFSLELEIDKEKIKEFLAKEYKEDSSWRYRIRFMGWKGRYGHLSSFLDILFNFIKSILTKGEFKSTEEELSRNIYWRKFLSRKTRSPFRIERPFGSVKYSPGKKRTRRKQYPNAVKIFLKHFTSYMVLSPDRSDFIGRRNIFRVINDSDKRAKIVGPSSDLLLKVKELIQSIDPGIIERDRLTKIYRPERELMRFYIPLFSLLDLEEYISSRNVVSSFQKASNEYADKRYHYSIRNSGLALEELFVEIYEMYFRKNARGSSLGKLKESVISEAKKIIGETDRNKQPENFSEDFNRINEKIDRLKKDGKTELFEAYSEIRRMYHKINRTRKNVDRIQQRDRKKGESFFFPSYVEEKINETIDLRNLVSHRTQTEITDFEASLALRGTFILSRWWEHERNQVDWTKDINEIVSGTVRRSTEVL